MREAALGPTTRVRKSITRARARVRTNVKSCACVCVCVTLKFICDFRVLCATDGAGPRVRVRASVRVLCVAGGGRAYAPHASGDTRTARKTPCAKMICEQQQLRQFKFANLSRLNMHYLYARALFVIYTCSRCPVSPASSQENASRLTLYSVS